MKNYAMAEEGSAFIRDGVDLSWPQAGVRDVIALDEKELPESFKLRVHYGVIVEVDMAPTKMDDPTRVYKLYEGEEARQIFEEPAGPVVVKKHSKRIGVDVSEITLIDSRDSLPVAEPIGTAVREPVAQPVLARATHRGG